MKAKKGGARSRRKPKAGEPTRSRRSTPKSRTRSGKRSTSSPAEGPDLEQSVLRLLAGKSYRPATVAVMLKLLKLPGKLEPGLKQTLRELERRGAIVMTKGRRYIAAAEADLVPGVIQLTRGGRGFLQPDEPGLKEIAIEAAATGTAMHGDRILVRRDRRPEGGRRRNEEPVLTGSVVRILERKRSRMVGTLQLGRRFLYVIPDDPRMSHNIVVPEPRDVGRPAQDGDKVVVEMVAWENRHTQPEGEVVEVLGAPDAEGVDMLSVLRQYDLPLSFPKKVLQEARAIADRHAEKVADAAELKRRVDCRSHRVITIDPDDAKDFDDAICVEQQGENWRVWVHIADVSHYVTPGSALDEEAVKRGNSSYLVDRVIPMLPEALSNELCSLKPEVDRLTKCVEMVIDRKGMVKRTKCYPAIIHSKRRYTYQEALAILERKPKGDLEQMLHRAHQVAQILRKARFKNGSLELDFPESKIRLDERGRVLRIDRMEYDISHQLIEEFMLLANEAVATRLLKLRRLALHRIHEAPKESRLADFRDQVLSHHIPCGNLNRRPEVQKVLRRLHKVAVGSALKIAFLRSLMRARYALESLGHYGLAKDHYTHFTSPIRRYADLVVHRVLFDEWAVPGRELRRIADHISTTERTSADAERDSRDIKLYAHLEAQLESGDRTVYEVLVTDVRNFGFFIDVTDLGMGGMVHLSSVEDDFFDFDPARGQLTARRSHRTVSLGDTVKVQIYKIDRFKKQVDFQLVEDGSARRKRGRRSEAPTRSRGDKETKRRSPSARGSSKGRSSPPKSGRRSGSERSAAKPKATKRGSTRKSGRRG